MIMGKYVIVVESGSDVTPELCERYGIVRVPMHVTIGDETVEDGSIDPLEIYSRCNELGVMPKTSGCSPADFAHVYDRIHAEQPDATILHLAYSEATTCSHQSSKIAAQGRDYVFSMDTPGHDHYANDMWNDPKFMHLDFSQRQRGDLICYNGHIAIYLGNDQIIEAASPRYGVRVHSVYVGYPIKGVLRPFV